MSNLLKSRMIERIVMPRIPARISSAIIVCLLVGFSGCFFLRKDKDPKKLVRDLNGSLNTVIEQIDTLEERVKRMVQEGIEKDSTSVLRDSIELEQQ